MKPGNLQLNVNDMKTAWLYEYKPYNPPLPHPHIHFARYYSNTLYKPVKITVYITIPHLIQTTKLQNLLLQKK